MCLDPGHYHKETFWGACIVYLVICSLLWIYSRRIPQGLKRLMLFIGRNTFPLLLFSPVFTILAKYYQSLLLRAEPTGMLFLAVSVGFAMAGSFGITWMMDVTGVSRLFFGKNGLNR